MTDAGVIGSPGRPERSSAPSGRWRWPELRDAQRTVLLDVLVHGTRSRADLTRRSGLSRASLSRLTRELGDAGLVRETSASPAEGRGRPSEMIAIVPDAAHFIGFKLTGDSLYTVVTDLSAKIRHSEGEPLVTRDVADVVALIVRTAARLRERFPRIAAIGVCLAGDVRVDPSGGGDVVVGSAFLGWDEVPLQALIEESVELPVSVGNDVQALTTAHHWFGAGVGSSSLAVIGLGAGIGCGIVVGDQPVRGARGHPGKVGHLPVTPDGPSCDVGHVGCVSAYVTIPAILRNAGGSAFRESHAAARAGQARAHTAFLAAAEALGAVVASLANLVDPERIIVTGEGLAVAEYAPEHLATAVRERLDPAAEPPTVILQPFQFADYAWGAAITAISELV
ncbi:ROK family transcriptional regulator [Microbacterium betulae]|uniref:ROK family transcriptional regulator n=1 Tax=Microbacterium betulae TaxID=2981139 RepID=A0AA97FMP4_9MICO|nr:ROK family transcriptional regulator [Microbacterium sp. AB]WOF24232.1 ROK family transcriptional regulator [Microbacterium sp. AB]